jgi:UrcA family protein
MNVFGKFITILALTASVAVNAQKSASVEIGDLDLATVKGQQVMALRIDRAARTLCASEALSQSPQMLRAEHACRIAAKNQAIASFQNRAAQQVASR